MTSELRVLLDEYDVGRVRRDGRGRLSFVYDESWRAAREAYPLSLSMPLARTEHEHRVVDAFLWGLLPDNELILERWAKRFHVSARNAFGLLTHIGEDVAGAVRLIGMDKAVGRTDPEIVWLDEHDIAERLRALEEDISLWRRPDDAGQFSLAGAQPKIALSFDGKRWGLPRGAEPTTHILKPGAVGFDGHAQNEHFCLTLAHELGLPVAASHVQHFEDKMAIVVERYDRLRTPNGMVRVHQEDVCQSLGVHPAKKYENEGGPGARQIIGLLREYSGRTNDDITTFIGALAFAWLTGGTDAHAKNYSLLIGAAGVARLAPLYDLASALPYPELQVQKLKLAMKIGGKYRLRDIGPYQWEKLAKEVALEREIVLTQVKEMADRVSDVALKVWRKLKREGLSHPLLPALANTVASRGREVSALFAGS